MQGHPQSRVGEDRQVHCSRDAAHVTKMGAMPPGRILVVDDDWFARQVYADALQRDGHTVVSAESGEAALTLLRQQTFHVLVTDLVMPGMDGLQLLDAAKRQTPGIEVLVLTSVDSVETAVRAMRCGAWHYLVKPVSADALGLDVKRCLERRQLLERHAELTRYAELFEVSQRISACLEADRLGPLALDALRTATAAEVGVLCRLSEGELKVQATRGLDERQGAWLADTVYESDGAAVVESDEPTEIEGVGRLIPARDPRLRRLENALVVPLFADGERLGAALMVRGDPQPFGEAAVRDAAFLGRCLALALRNAERFTEAQSKALLDSLTGLRNASTLDTVLDEELRARAATGEPLSAIFMDLDFFKKVNDQHGHAIGSRVIAEVGRLLRHYVREEDLLVRYGGDEFIAVLRDANEQAAVHVAERIRRAVETHSFLGREGYDIRLTLCAGVSTWPAPADDRESLLHQADAAMFHGKRHHRNAVYAWSEIASIAPEPTRPPGLRG